MEDAEDSDVPERFRPLLKTFPGEMDLRQKLYPDVSAIEDSKIQCTICLKDVKHVFLLKKKTYKHFFLQVVVCKSCMKFYGNGDFSAESDGDDKYCRWCGQGGKLYLCSKCPTAFCKKCIKQNLERKFVLKVENDNWLCFVCDPTPLFKLRALSWAIDKHLENEKKKEEAENSRKREAPKAPRPRTVKIPKIEFEEDKFRHNVDSSRLWLSGIVDKARSPANDTDFNSIHKDVNSMASVSDFERIVSALVACLDAKMDAIVELKGQLASGVQKLVETIGQKEKTVGKNKGQKFRSKHCQDEVTAVKDSAARAKSTTVNSNQEQPKKKGSAHNDNSSDSEASSTRNGLDTTKDPGAETRLDDIFDGDTTIPPSDLDNSCTDMFCEDEAKPVIRLRNLSDLIDPKLKSKKTPEKTKAAVKTKKLQEKPKPKEDPDITIISSDDDRPPKPKKHTKKVVNKEDRKPKITTSTPKVALCSKTTVEKTDDSLSDEETLVSNPKHRKLSLATKEHAKKSDEDLTDVPGGSTVSNTSKGLKESKSSKNSLEGKDLDKDPTSPLSNHSSTSRKSKDAAQPLFFSSTDDENPTDEEPQKPTENSKKKIIKEKETQSTKKTKGEPPVTIEKAAPKVISGTSSSSSSSDPLSEGSSDDGKKKKRSVRQDSDSSQEKTKSKVRRSKKPAVDLATDDSDDDGKAFLKKEKKLNKRDKTDKTKKLACKAAKKRPLEEDSASDYDISKLCDLKSLRATAGNCSVSSDEDEEPESKTTNVTKKRKANNNEDKLSDFFDSGDDKLNSEEEKEEDLNDVFKREFSHLTNGSVTHDDILGDILKMSSGSENEDKSPPLSGSEESAPSKKSKKDLNKSEKSKTQKEQSANHKGKKKYADKLMKMKIDSTDSDDVDAGLEKYNKAKAKQAEKKHESSDEEPVVTKAPKKGKKKANKKKKMFSDSDESPIEDAESEKESDKDGSNASGSDDDKKRKKSGSESDSSAATKKKKRRRIRAATSDESETDSEGGGRRRKKKDPNESSKGRKSIRKILKEDDLKKTTQEALKAEQERKKRIKEKQELYNKMVVKENTEAPKELTELVLDFDPKTKETILCVDKDLVKKLKPHQAQGIKFMWDSCFETVKMAKTKTGSGCILAHCMGLGKSLQVVTLVHTLITNPDTGVRKVLVVAPLSTVLNWVNEFDKWLSDIGSGQDVNVFHMNKVQTAHRTYLLKDWDRNGGVLIMGYNLLRNLSNAKAKFSKAAKKVFQENLVDPGPDVVICDEGHILKNEKTAVNQCMTQIKTRRRIVLTGTPLQNNLVEYHCMVQFVKPNLLGTKKEFTNRFVNPIQNGQFEDSTQHDVKIMKRRAHVLHTMLDGIVQRKDYSVLTPYLPPKFEYVIHLKLSDVQVKLYRYYLLHMVHGGNAEAEAEGSAPKGRRLFVDFQNLMWICLHPRTLLMKADKDEIKRAMMDETDEEGSLKDFIDDDKSTSESDFKTSGSSDEDSGSDASVKSVENKPRRERKTRAQGSPDPEDEPAPVKQWWSDLIDESDMDNVRASTKLFLFFTILKYCEEIGDKLLIFSQSLYTLDILEYFLDKIDTETQKPEEERCPGIKGFEGSWAKGLDYFRLDGSSACENREAWCKSFNRPDNTRARLFLISTRAGGLGINLTGANRVIIFDASWNPSFDVQSLFRVYRFGQEKPCYIYRFLSKGTMEEKIYERQVAKLSTSLRVIDEQQIDRHFSHSALNELYMFDPEGSELQGTPVLPKDRLMAELLQSHKDIILSHHQHDSLLENQEDQELTEEERKAAWQEFENEKTQKPPPPTFTLNAMANLMIEIRTKLQMQNPTWTEQQIASGTFALIQRLPDYQQFMPYFNLMLQQQMQQQQQFAQRPMGQYPSMQFPSFRYPVYNSMGPMMGNNAGMMGNNAGMLGNLLNTAGTSGGNAGLASLLNSMAPNANNSVPNPKLVSNLKSTVNSSGAGTSTNPVVLDDSGPIELDD